MKHCSQHAKHQVSRTSSAFIIIVFFFMISGGILVLLIFSNKVIHVALCLSEFPSHPFLLQCTSARRLSSWTWPRTARSLTLLNISCTEVELPTKVEAMERPLGGMSHTLDFTLLGIHSTKAGRVLVLHIHDLFVHFLCAHLSPEHRGSRPSSSDRGMDRLHTSCSWHPTFVVSALAQRVHGSPVTLGNGMLGEQNPPWRSGGVGMGSSSRPASAGLSWVDPGILSNT